MPPAKKAPAKRSPSAYNIFMKETIGKLKNDLPPGSSLSHRELYMQAVALWHATHPKKASKPINANNNDFTTINNI